MPTSFIVSLIVFIVFTSFLVIFEYKYRRREKKGMSDVQDVMKPAAKVADELYKKKYGHASSELTDTFPELREVRGSGR